MQDIKKLKEMAEPIKKFLETQYNQHCVVIITTDGVKVLSTEISTPLL